MGVQNMRQSLKRKARGKKLDEEIKNSWVGKNRKEGCLENIPNVT
jgi:hypothetical protein